MGRRHIWFQKIIVAICVNLFADNTSNVSCLLFVERIIGHQLLVWVEPGRAFRKMYLLGRNIDLHRLTLGLPIISDEFVHHAHSQGSTRFSGSLGFSWRPDTGSNSPRCSPRLLKTSTLPCW